MGQIILIAIKQH